MHLQPLVPTDVVNSVGCFEGRSLRCRLDHHTHPDVKRPSCPTSRRDLATTAGGNLTGLATPNAGHCGGPRARFKCQSATTKWTDRIYTCGAAGVRRCHLGCPGAESHHSTDRAAGSGVRFIHRRVPAASRPPTDPFPFHGPQGPDQVSEPPLARLDKKRDCPVRIALLNRCQRDRPDGLIRMDIKNARPRPELQQAPAPLGGADGVSGHEPRAHYLRHAVDGHSRLARSGGLRGQRSRSRLLAASRHVLRRPRHERRVGNHMNATSVLTDK